MVFTRVPGIFFSRIVLTIKEEDSLLPIGVTMLNQKRSISLPEATLRSIEGCRYLGGKVISENKFTFGRV
jgi:hypothetical protein